MPSDTATAYLNWEILLILPLPVTADDLRLHLEFLCLDHGSKSVSVMAKSDHLVFYKTLVSHRPKEGS